MHAFQTLAMFPFPINQLDYFLREFIQIIAQSVKEMNNMALLYNPLENYNHIKFHQLNIKRITMNYVENKIVCSIKVTLIIKRNIKKKNC